MSNSLISDKKILVVQRVITSYRLELLKCLCTSFGEIGIITSKGEQKGTLKKAAFENNSNEKLKVIQLKSLKIAYKGESRSTSLFLYPSIVNYIKYYDILILEGTTNILNNIYIIPIAKLLNKKIVWWDSGYSPKVRTFRRKVMDFFLSPFVSVTDLQMAYSSKGADYIQQYMGGKNTFLNLNTINTAYFEEISNEVINAIDNYRFSPQRIKLLYVGVVEKRKKIEELINIVLELNEEGFLFTLDIIGGGNQKDELANKYGNELVKFHGPIYDKEKLKNFYFNSDLFVLPGDGGLAILQSLLYGLPVVCLKGADGTELDYIEDKDFLLDNTNDIHGFLKNLKKLDKQPYKNYVSRVSSTKWVNNLCRKIECIQ